MKMFLSSTVRTKSTLLAAVVEVEKVKDVATYDIPNVLFKQR